MAIVEVERQGLSAIVEDATQAAYSAANWMRATRPAGRGQPSETRVTVEVLRRLGGLTPRALIGGKFVPRIGHETHIEVGVASHGAFDADDGLACPSMLWKQPFTVGLPIDFADAVMRELSAQGPLLPAGTVIIDRAAFDLINSSEAIFTQATAVFRTVLIAYLYGQDAAAAARAVMTTW